MAEEKKRKQNKSKAGGFKQFSIDQWMQKENSSSSVATDTTGCYRPRAGIEMFFAKKKKNKALKKPAEAAAVMMNNNAPTRRVAEMPKHHEEGNNNIIDLSIDEEDDDDEDNKKDIIDLTAAQDEHYDGHDDTAALLFSPQEFYEMWSAAEVDHGLATEEIENSKMMRAANSKVHSSCQQKRAQYGRLMPQGFETLLQPQFLNLQPSDLFLDIGHGLGSLVLQAAYTKGCQARGIELDHDRNVVAGEYARNLEHQRTHLPQYLLQQQSQQQQHGSSRHDDDRPRRVGTVQLKCGELQDPKFRRFLIGAKHLKQKRQDDDNGGDDFIVCPKHVVKAWVNNYNGVFGDKSAKPTDKIYLDHFVGGLLALMRPGSIMVTLHKLPLGPSLEDANMYRKKHHFEERPDASFFSLEELELGRANEITSWSHQSGKKEIITAYKYTRVDQGTTNGEAVFYCCNKACPLWNGAQPVIQEIQHNGPKIVARTGCMEHCAVNVGVSRKRKQAQALPRPNDDDDDDQ